jgi:hypothetical protein
MRKPVYKSSRPLRRQLQKCRTAGWEQKQERPTFPTNNVGTADVFLSGFASTNPETRRKGGPYKYNGKRAGWEPFDCAPFLRQGEQDKPAL